MPGKAVDRAAVLRRDPASGLASCRAARSRRPGPARCSSARKAAIGPASSASVRSPSRRRCSAISSAVRGGRADRRSRFSTRPIAWGSSQPDRWRSRRASSGSSRSSSTTAEAGLRSLRLRLVPLVEVGRREPEDQLRGERRGDLAAAADDPDRSGLDRVEEAAEPGQVEVVVEALAEGLEHDREVGELPGDLEQVLGAEPLEPERRPLRRVGAGHQQGPARRSGGTAGRTAPSRAAPRGSGPRPASPVRPSNRSSGGSSMFGQAEQEAVVAVQAGGGHAEPLAEPRRAGRASAPRCSLPPNGVSTARPSSPAGSRNVSIRIVRSSGTAPASRCWRPRNCASIRAAAGSSRHSRSSQGSSSGIVQPAGDLAAERADRLAQLGRARRRLAAPERHHARLALGPGDDHAMRLDRVDPPGRVAQHEGLADPPLEDELLVELAEPRAAVAQVDRELAGVGDRPAADQGQLGRPGQGGQPVVDPVPGDPGAQVAESRAGEPARDQPQDALERLGATGRGTG